MKDDYAQSDQITPWLIYPCRRSVAEQLGKKLTKISLILADAARLANTSQILGPSKFQLVNGMKGKGSWCMVYWCTLQPVSDCLGDPIHRAPAMLISDVLEKPKWLLVKAIFPC